MIDWWRHIDGYCERDDPTFWAEPLNAWSNAGFWVAAAVFGTYLLSTNRRPGGRVPAGLLRDLIVLDLLLVGIGAGSFCFHTFAVVWAAMLDVGFIVLWVYWYLWITARRVLAWTRLITAVLLVGHLGTAIALLAATGWFLMSYLPTALAAYGLAIHASRHALPGRLWLWASAAVFTLSMAMAGLDAPLCGAVPTGTHFLWHLLNAIALLLGSIGLVRNLLPAVENERVITPRG